MSISAAIIDATRRHLPHIRELRRELHQIPEVGFRERKTSHLLHTELVEAGYDVRSGLAGTGLAADLDTGRDGGYVILRADMDGLPVIDACAAPHHSRHEGFSHCCGHDGHAAALIGVARVLKTIEPALRGRVRLVFQPAEEMANGALAMIEDGLLCDGPADAAFAPHAWPGLPTNVVASRNGAFMAACDTFDIAILGVGGHGARPALARNPLTALARIVPVLEDMTTSTRVVSPCTVRIGEKPNIIAQSGILSGTIRTLDSDDRERTMDEIRSRVAAAAGELGMHAETTFETGCPMVANAPELYGVFRHVATALLGPNQVVELPEPSMGSEDFGYFLNHMPGLMFRVGNGEQSPELHNPRFDFNDNALDTTILTMAGLAARICNGGLD